MAVPRRRDGARSNRARTSPDACPGAWRRHEAADGALARFRPAGGAVTAAELRLLAGAAVTGGSPVELTSRGSLQVRGLAARTADDLAASLTLLPDAGGVPLLDASGRDVPCGLLASPRSGRAGPVDGGAPSDGALGPLGPADGALRPRGGSGGGAPRADVDPWARAVAEGLRGRAELPGRFLVALDDGRGDVSGQGADVTVVAGPDDVALLLDGTDTGLRVTPADAPALALAAVDAFLAVRDGAWRMSEVAAEEVVDGIRDRVRTTTATAPEVRPGPADPSTLGVDAAGTCEVLPRLGEIELDLVAALVGLLESGGGASLRVTPWRTLVLRDLPDPVAARARLEGLAETDPRSRWVGLSACVGAPRCAKSLSDVRGDLAAAVATGHAGGQVRAHWVGCARACGTPGGRVAVVEATGSHAHRTVVRSGRVAR